MNMKKNILITFLFKEGAGPVFTLEMARGFAQNGCNVYVIISSKIANNYFCTIEAVVKYIAKVIGRKKQFFYPLVTI